jgi:rhodanese-related sulfurtransferase
MKKRKCYILYFVTLMLLSALLIPGVQAAGEPQASEIQQKPVAAGSEISTPELKQILTAGKIPVIDVRPEKEYAVSHIPGSINIFETEIERMMELCGKSSRLVLYCNGPYCHKTGRVADNLSKKGCTNIKKYQDGLPIWRALGNIAETSLAGFKYVFSSDRTAVFIDARTEEEFSAGSMPGARNLEPGEIDAANDDGRLPYTDHGTRVIVFGNSANQARQLAEAIAHRAYWNSSYLAGTYDDLKRAKLW